VSLPISPLDDEGARRIRQRLIEDAGGYLRNIVRRTGETCGVCACPVKQSYTACWRCKTDQQQFGDQLADLVVPLCYAVNGQQSGHLMQMYKDRLRPDRRGRRLLIMLLLAALHFRGRCLVDRIGHEFDRFAIVPSLRLRPGRHPLHVVATSILRCPEIGLTANPFATPHSRTINPDDFTPADPAAARGRHVLLIEDTWVSGSHSQSAAASLKQAGAATVTIVALARWINPAEEPSTGFVRHMLRCDYDPHRCPI
jgi:hypothetical protein